MNHTVSFIGSGNMGGAIIRAACQALDPAKIQITDYDPDKAKALAAQTGCKTAADNEEAVRSGDYIFLCVKPQVMGSVLEGISAVLNDELANGHPKVLVSIAAGLTLETLRSKLTGACQKLPIIRIMPNTPVAIGKGMLALSAKDDVNEEMIADVKEILSKAGRLEQLPENMIDAFTSVSGCAPAFVCLFIEALADGGVLCGLTRTQALTYAAQTVMGSASMVLETGEHPGALKDAVCSPKGSTIVGVAALERHGFRSAAIEAVIDSYNKNTDLGKH